MGRREQPSRQPAQRPRGIGGLGQLVELGQLPPQPLARLGRGAQALPADVGVQAVGQLRRLEAPGRAQVGQQVRGARLTGGEQGAAGGAEQPPPQRGVRQWRRVAGGQRDSVLGEDVPQQGRGLQARAVDDDDLSGGHAGPLQLEHLLGDELGLGALPAGLQQGHRLTRIHARGRVRRCHLEQRALEVVQHRPGAIGVMLVLGGELDDPLGQRPQLLHRLGAGHEGLATRLVGERHGDLGADDAGQRLDRVALERGEVVKAVEEDGLGAPAMRGGSQRVQRPPRVPLAVHAAEPVELAYVVAVDPADLVRVGRPADVLGRPAAQAGDEPARVDERALQLGDQLAGGGGEARARGG